MLIFDQHLQFKSFIVCICFLKLSIFNPYKTATDAPKFKVAPQYKVVETSNQNCITNKTQKKQW